MVNITSQNSRRTQIRGETSYLWLETQNILHSEPQNMLQGGRPMLRCLYLYHYKGYKTGGQKGEIICLWGTAHFFFLW